MNNIKFVCILVVVLMVSAFAVKESISWKISEGYTIRFISNDPTGVFTKMDGEIAFNESDLTSSRFDVKVDVSSINTGNGMKNKHARSAKWFDAEKYPYIHFVSERFEKTPNGYQVSGSLEMHGVSKSFDIPFTFKNNLFEASFPIDRTEFSIGEPGGKVPNELAVELSVPVTRK